MPRRVDPDRRVTPCPVCGDPKCMQLHVISSHSDNPQVTTRSSATVLFDRPAKLWEVQWTKITDPEALEVTVIMMEPWALLFGGIFFLLLVSLVK